MPVGSCVCSGSSRSVAEGSASSPTLIHGLTVDRFVARWGDYEDWRSISGRRSRETESSGRPAYTCLVNLRSLEAVRYVTSMREGGSLPALVETDDGKCFVTKLRGAGQGPLALVAEIITGELARVLGLQVPEVALIDLDPAFARNEPDAEIQDLFRASSGLNVGLEFLPQATCFDPASGDRTDARTASLTVWLDAFTLNIDRTPRNANLLCWQDGLWLIDHGASLYFQHHWPGAESKITSPFALIQEHILLPWAEEMADARAVAHDRLTDEVLREIVDLVPEPWLLAERDGVEPVARRADYVRFLSLRLERSEVFEEEVRRARA